jgi:multiple sugar transport system permease protein
VDIYNPTIVWIPQHFTLDNFKKVMEVMHYGKSLWNTFMLSGTITVLTTTSCALAGYAFAKLRFKGSGIVFACAILTILVPPQTIMVPNAIPACSALLCGKCRAYRACRLIRYHL